ncbi:hypothetical protein PoB_000293400 [Plakobranchus ocellatus]|uniref:Uncharacterized protein n=1 Tax=Plakobranchus ocellatus TaxID=259542 RepID=A0AAV3Y2G5_9GAST|nr:hypothetical protein PoB_000293400 [Plakobranchus ocellatus]
MNFKNWAEDESDNLGVGRNPRGEPAASVVCTHRETGRMYDEEHCLALDPENDWQLKDEYATCLGTYCVRSKVTWFMPRSTVNCIHHIHRREEEEEDEGGRWERGEGGWRTENVAVDSSKSALTSEGIFLSRVRVQSPTLMPWPDEASKA